MTTTRCFLGGLLLVSACISRGGGVDPPADVPVGVDMTVTPTDAPVGVDASTPTDRTRRDVMCAPTMARENTATRCNDGLDNDCNGFADCDDFACQTCAVPACLTNNSVRLSDGGTCMCGDPEATPASCSDGLDNDCDGFTDCQDFSCQTCAVPVCLSDGGLQRGGDAGFCLCRGAENTNTACGDGVDNDCNGFADCNDFSCSRGDAGVTVCGSGDSGTPRMDVAGCDATGRENTPGACSDGVDNDCNGFTDCVDFSCQTCAVPACLTNNSVRRSDGGVCMCASESTNGACGDGIDNDCDSFIDCRDFDCTMSDGGAVTVCRDGG